MPRVSFSHTHTHTHAHTCHTLAHTHTDTWHKTKDKGDKLNLMKKKHSRIQKQFVSFILPYLTFKTHLCDLNPAGVWIDLSFSQDPDKHVSVFGSRHSL